MSVQCYCLYIFSRFSCLQLLDQSMDRKKAKVHNDELKQREKLATSLFLGARANLLRDKVALVAARKKYSSLAELLNDPSTDHQQVRACCASTLFHCDFFEINKIQGRH